MILHVRNYIAIVLYLVLRQGQKIFTLLEMWQGGLTIRNCHDLKHARALEFHCLRSLDLYSVSRRPPHRSVSLTKCTRNIAPIPSEPISKLDELYVFCPVRGLCRFANISGQFTTSPKVLRKYILTHFPSQVSPSAPHEEAISNAKTLVSVQGYLCESGTRGPRDFRLGVFMFQNPIL